MVTSSRGQTSQPLRIALIVHYWEAVVQRPHHWYREASARGHDTHVYTLPRTLRGPGRNLSIQRNVHYLPRVPIESVLARLGPKRRQRADAMRARRFEAFLNGVVQECGRRFDVVFYASAPLFALHRTQPGGLLVYDCMDEWSGFTALREDALRYEPRIASQSDLILAVSEPLAQRLRSAYGAEKVMVVPNGCDYDLFARAQRRPRQPQDPPCFGYTGTISEWFDWEAIQAVCHAYPQARVQLVGPVDGNIQVPTLPVEMVGRQPYEKMPHFNVAFDVCLIPFHDVGGTHLVSAVSPIKLYEYLASGRPVVSSPMPDTLRLAERGVVHVADTPESFAHEVGEALALADEPALIQRRKEIARQHSWQARWLQIEARIQQMRAERGGV